jgi:hypothetical protein
MAKIDIDNKIRGLVDSFATDLTSLIRESAMDTVREALGDGGSSGRRSSGRGRPAAVAASPAGARRASSLPKGAKRAPDEIVKLTEQLGEYIKTNKGERIEQIAKGMNVSTRELNLPVKKLLATKVIKTKGQKRATQYFPR